MKKSEIFAILYIESERASGFSFLHSLSRESVNEPVERLRVASLYESRARFKANFFVPPEAKHEDTYLCAEGTTKRSATYVL